MEAVRRKEVAIVGGGPAGLAAAVYLARLKRSVAVIDGSQSRLANVPRTRNYPGFPDGIPGPALLAALREQVSRYPIDHVGAQVESLERTSDGFRLAWPGGALDARMVLMATGASDVPPAMPHLAHALRTGLLRYCPVCDGYEVIDLKVGVVANGAAGVQEALYLRHFTDDVTVFMMPDAPALDAAEHARAGKASIRLAAGAVDSIREWNGKISVRHGTEDTACDSLYSALGLRIHSNLAQEAGARTDENGYLVTDRHHATNVRGLYAAGDVTLGLNQISVAVGGGAIAGAAMHLALARAERD
ncbi:MAG: NAD(P)/FAD-dependent oxidoreductase [Variovorax sp.]|nr:MAG: NAD(P)/FAD-dependent oxidoreductase [Variovorax sp.]